MVIVGAVQGDAAGLQGTLYGRSAVGGIVNVSFKKSEFANSGSVDLEAGKTVRVAADYVISYPKEARLQER